MSKIYNMDDPEEVKQFWEEYERLTRWDNFKEKIKKANSIATILLLPFIIIFATVGAIAGAGAKECKKADSKRY